MRRGHEIATSSQWLASSYIGQNPAKTPALPDQLHIREGIAPGDPRVRSRKGPTWHYPTHLEIRIRYHRPSSNPIGSARS